MREFWTGLLTGIGGGGAIIVAFSKYIGDLWATRFLQEKKAEIDHEMESYRAKLQKSAFLFEKEFDAVLRFSAILEEVMPDKYHPDMDWADACEEIYQRFDEHERTLKDFIREFSAIVDAEALNFIKSAATIAANGKFELPENDHYSMGNDFYEKLQSANDRLLTHLRVQSSP
jgi:hypothetical protein